jgi:hypothetical protein
MLQLRGRGAGAMTQAHPLGKDDGVAAKYLEKELKLDLYKEQQTSLVTALTKPEEWLTKRDTSMRKLIAELSPIYNESIENYMKLYPTDEAIDLANQDIKSLFDVKMRHLELEQPGASLLFQGAVLNNNIDKIKANAVLTGVSGGSSKEEFKKYYKEKRARKKAKRSKQSE